MPTISALPAASVVNTADLVPIVQVGTTKKATFSLVVSLVSTNIQITEAQVTNLTTDLASKLSAAANLSDVASASTSRTNLGLGTAATHPATDFLQVANNLSDLNSTTTARTNLGLGSAAVINAPISSANGGTGVSSPTAGTLPVAEGASNYNFIGPLTNGQLLIGSTGVDPVAANLTAGSGISIANTAGGIQISGTASLLGWNDITGTSASMVPNAGYAADNAGLVTLTMPTTAAFGTGITVVAKGAGGFSIVYGSGQSIKFGTQTSTTTSGSISSTNVGDSIQLICMVANTAWTAIASIGNLTVA